MNLEQGGGLKPLNGGCNSDRNSIDLLITNQIDHHYSLIL